MKVIRNNLDVLANPSTFTQFMGGTIRAYEVEKTLFDGHKGKRFLLCDEPLTLSERLKCVREILPMDILIDNYFKSDL